MTDIRSDEALLEATARGDEDAFIEIYTRHRDRVFRYACRMTGSPEAARDITHACFASLLAAPRRFRPGRAALGTYLCAAARNQSLEHMRRSRREPPLPRSAEQRPSADRGPLVRLLDNETSRAVRDALQALAPLHREVVILADYEEMDLATIATIVGADLSAVKMRLHRARKKLRLALAQYLDTPRRVGT